MALYIPNNLQIDEIIATYPSGIPSFNKEKLLFIVHSIIIGKLNGRRIYGDGYVTISSTTLLKVLGNHYSKYVTYLVARKVIELYIAPGGETYIVGKHSQAYRLHSKYLTQVTRYEIETFTLGRKIIQYFKADAIEARQEEAESKSMVNEMSQPLAPGEGYSFDKLDEPKPRVPKKTAKKTRKVKATHKSDVLNKREFEWEGKRFKGMYKWLRDGGLSINRELADKYLSIKLAVQHVDTRSRDWDWGRPEPKNPIEQFNAAMIHLDRLETGEDNNDHFDYSIHRFHSIVSAMPKMLRNGLTYNGEQLAVIDISNSQPYMSNLFFNPGFWLYEEGTHLKLSDLGIIPSSIFSTPSSFASFIMFLKTLSNPQQAKLHLNYMRYRHLTSEGLFYKTINREIGRMNGYKELYTDLSDIKRELYILFFSSNRYNPGGEDVSFKKGFKAFLPTVNEVYSMIKERNRHNLAHLYFLVETFVVYYRVVARIQKELPKVSFWTIHDGIATTVGNEEDIKAIMDEELTMAIGVKPHMKVEYWQEEKIHAEMARYEAIIEKKGLSEKIREATAKGEL